MPIADPRFRNAAPARYALEEVVHAGNVRTVGVVFVGFVDTVHRAVAHQGSAGIDWVVYYEMQYIVIWWFNTVFHVLVTS